MSVRTGLYPGEQFVSLQLSEAPALVDNLLWEGDHTLLVGKEKSGKSLLCLQLLSALSCGADMFGLLSVPKPVPVIYCQGEGKLADTSQNHARMRQVLDCTPKNFAIFYFPSLALDTEEGLKELFTCLDSWQKPTVLILDPLYMFMRGDLIDNADARRMVAHLRHLSEHYKPLTLLITHHAHRPLKNQRGQVIDEGDDSLFGSFVWKAFPDNVYLFQRLSNDLKDKRRRFSCDTQRMAKAVSNVNLYLEDQQSLYYRVDERHPGSHAKLLSLLQATPQGLPFTELVSCSGYAKSTCWMTLSEMVDKRQVIRVSDGLPTPGYRLI